MTVRYLAASVLALLALALPATGVAATPAQIHADAADGSIDGSYSMAELRAADEAVSAEQREYYGWEDAYGEYLRGMATPAPNPPTTPPVAAPSAAAAAGAAPGDFGRRKPSAPGRRSWPAPGTSAQEPAPRTLGPGRAPTPIASDEPAGGPEIHAAQADARAHRESGSGTVPLVPLLLAAPLLVLAVGTGRAIHRRRAAARG